MIRSHVYLRYNMPQVIGGEKHIFLVSDTAQPGVQHIPHIGQVLVEGHTNNNNVIQIHQAR